MRSHRLLAALLLAVAVSSSTPPALAASAQEIDADVTVALESLFARTPETKTLASRAKGVLVFPSVVKAGFLGAAQFGEGALRQGGQTVGYYSTAAASYGLQAGVQKFAYALFFMTDAAMDHLAKSRGWELGSGPSVVVMDTGMAKSFSTTNARDDVYAFIFDQSGLMAGLGLQGTKITKIDR